MMRPLHFVALCVLSAVGVGAGPTGRPTSEQPAMKRVLILHQELVSRPFRAKFSAAFVQAMRDAQAAPVDIYEEALETERFPRADQQRLFTDYLQKKYADRPMDVLVVVGIKALSFARE